MTKTLSFALSLAIALVGIAAASPAQAASRFVDISPDRMADRCLGTGGSFFSPDAGVAVCDLQTVAITCAFVSTFQANCRWPGIDFPIAVTRIIGMSHAIYVGGSSGRFEGAGDVQMAP